MAFTVLVVIFLSILFVVIVKMGEPEGEISSCAVKSSEIITAKVNDEPSPVQSTARNVKALIPDGTSYKKPYASPSGYTTGKSTYPMRNTHPFHFLGGEELAQMGATWFVSYCYHRHIDYSYSAWRRVKTASVRRTVYERTEKYHAYWLRQILYMSDERLNTNRMNVNARDTKRMARELLASASFANG